ncbi:type IV pilin [Haloparvum sedimenti]|uniref:type IV pilin n=1 Tax=Haloparvum sedimenti TaxID=1678448 RepID=UPI00071E85A6|nr:polymer-forming cytoskeletal protein [Haloparvum sedimenti]
MVCSDGADRAISPVVGVVILVGIVALLAGTGGVLILGLADDPDPAPGATLDVEAAGDGLHHALVHGGGDTIDGDALAIRGAADPDAAAGTRLTAGTAVELYPVDEEIMVVWRGDDDTTHVLTTATVDRTLPEPDRTCEWVDEETDGGADPITIDGLVVDCDVETDEGITVSDGGVVVGESASGAKDFDGDDATVYGDVAVEKVVNIQTGTVRGSVVSRTADAKLGNVTVDGSVTARKVVEVLAGSAVGGDVESENNTVKVFDSTVEGAVVAADGEQVKLDNATVEGHVYVDEAAFDCTDSTIDGRDCGSYTPRDPDEA